MNGVGKPPTIAQKYYIKRSSLTTAPSRKFLNRMLFLQNSLLIVFESCENSQRMKDSCRTRHFHVVQGHVAKENWQDPQIYNFHVLFFGGDES